MTGEMAPTPKFWRGIIYLLLLASGLTTGAAIGASPARPDSRGKERNPSVIRAIYHDRTLLILTADGRIRAWHEGAKVSVPVAAPKKTGSFCANGDRLYLVAVDDDGKRIIVWRGAPGAWSQVLQLAGGENDSFVALDCSGSDPVMLTASAIRFLNSGQKVAINQQQPRQPGYFTTLQHGGYLYVGANAGEWGGGLRRFPLVGGSEEIVDASDPATLCGGKLNRACHPVTGLAPDPVRPDCILATTGLIHMSLSHGSVLRICNTEITVAFTKPFKRALPRNDDPARPKGTESNIPFYSLGKGASGVWAVGSDGIYRFADDGLPAFTAFPQVFQMPASGIDWSHRDFVLVATDMNQRHSVSGRSLILMPR
jgi:hypothetical protein